jgi:hypothetical protein
MACAGAPGAAVGLTLGAVDGVALVVGPADGVSDGVADGDFEADGSGAQPASIRVARPIVATNRSRVLAR